MSEQIHVGGCSPCDGTSVFESPSVAKDANKPSRTPILDSDESFSELTPRQKIDTALGVVRDTCPAGVCVVPETYSLEWFLNPDNMGSTNTFSGALAFNYRLLNWSPGESSAALTLSIAYHESMHVGQTVWQRVLNLLPGSQSHSQIIDSAGDMAVQNQDLYLERLQQLPQGE